MSYIFISCIGAFIVLKIIMSPKFTLLVKSTGSGISSLLSLSLGSRWRRVGPQRRPSVFSHPQVHPVHGRRRVPLHRPQCHRRVRTACESGSVLWVCRPISFYQLGVLFDIPQRQMFNSQQCWVWHVKSSAAVQRAYGNALQCCKISTASLRCLSLNTRWQSVYEETAFLLNLD